MNRPTTLPFPSSRLISKWHFVLQMAACFSLAMECIGAEQDVPPDQPSKSIQDTSGTASTHVRGIVRFTNFTPNGKPVKNFNSNFSIQYVSKNGVLLTNIFDMGSEEVFYFDGQSTYYRVSTRNAALTPESTQSRSQTSPTTPDLLPSNVATTYVHPGLAFMLPTSNARFILFAFVNASGSDVERLNTGAIPFGAAGINDTDAYTPEPIYNTNSPFLVAKATFIAHADAWSNSITRRVKEDHMTTTEIPKAPFNTGFEGAVFRALSWTNIAQQTLPRTAELKKVWPPAVSSTHTNTTPAEFYNLVVTNVFQSLQQPIEIFAGEMSAVHDYRFSEPAAPYGVHYTSTNGAIAQAGEPWFDSLVQLYIVRNRELALRQQHTTARAHLPRVFAQSLIVVALLAPVGIWWLWERKKTKD